MTISTGNYESREGVNRTMFPATTKDGERVMIVEKITRANESTLLIAEDGRQFQADAGDSLNLVEVFIEKVEGIVEEAVEEVVEAVSDAAEAIGDAAGDALDAVQDTLGGDDGEEAEAEEA